MRTRMYVLRSVCVRAGNATLGGVRFRPSPTSMLTHSRLWYLSITKEIFQEYNATSQLWYAQASNMLGFTQWAYDKIPWNFMEWLAKTFDKPALLFDLLTAQAYL